MKKAVFSFFLLLFSLTPVYAAQFEMVDDYIIHYNAVNTSILSPKIAKAYGIVRSKNRALLNIAVRKKGSETEPVDSAVEAGIKASVVNLSKQLKEIEMEEIREPGAIYYIGVFAISNAETLDFTVEVKPENKGNVHTIKFRQEFFAQ